MAISNVKFVVSAAGTEKVVSAIQQIKLNTKTTVDALVGLNNTLKKIERRGLTGLQTEFNKTTSASKKLEMQVKKLQTANEQLKNTNAKLTAENKRLNASVTSGTTAMGKQGKGIRNLIPHVAAVTISYMAMRRAVNAVVEALKAGAEFEQQMAIVGGIVRATTTEFEMLAAAARHAGETTVWTATESANALRFLGMAGFDAAESIAALGGVLNLALIGEMELSRATDIATDTLRAFGLAAGELDRVVDVMVGTITRSNTNIEKMGQAMKFVAPVAAKLGYTVEEISAMIGVLSQSGIKAGIAGRALRMSFLRTMDAAKALGIESIHLVDILKELERRKMGAAELTETLKDLFGLRSTPAILTLMAGIDQLEEFTETLNNAKGETDKFIERLDTTSVEFKKLASVVKSVAISVFLKYADDLKESLKDLAQAIKDNKGEIEDFFETTIAGLKLLKDTAVLTISVLNTIAEKTKIDEFFRLQMEGWSWIFNYLDKILPRAINNLYAKKKIDPETGLFGIGLLDAVGIEASVEMMRNAYNAWRTEIEATKYAAAELKKEQDRLADSAKAYKGLYSYLIEDIAIGEIPSLLKAMGDEYSASLDKIFEGMDETTKTAFVDALNTFSAGYTEQLGETEKFTMTNVTLHEGMYEDIFAFIKEYFKKLDELSKRNARFLSDTMKSMGAFEDWANADIKAADKGLKEFEKQEKAKDTIRKKTGKSEESYRNDKLQAMKSLYEDLEEISGNYYDAQVQIIELEYEKYMEMLGLKLEEQQKWGEKDKQLFDALNRWKVLETIKLQQELLMYSGGFFGGIKAYLIQAQIDWENFYENLGELGSESLEKLGVAFEDTLVSVFKREFKDIGDIWDTLLDDLLDSFYAFVANMVKAWIMAGIGNLVVNISGAGAGTGIGGAGSPSGGGMGVFDILSYGKTGYDLYSGQGISGKAAHWLYNNLFGGAAAQQAPFYGMPMASQTGAYGYGPMGYQMTAPLVGAGATYGGGGIGMAGAMQMPGTVGSLGPGMVGPMAGAGIAAAIGALIMGGIAIIDHNMKGDANIWMKSTIGISESLNNLFTISVDDVINLGYSAPDAEHTIGLFSHYLEESIGMYEGLWAALGESSKKALKTTLGEANIEDYIFSMWEYARSGAPYGAAFEGMEGGHGTGSRSAGVIAGGMGSLFADYFESYIEEALVNVKISDVFDILTDEIQESFEGVDVEMFMTDIVKFFDLVGENIANITRANTVLEDFNRFIDGTAAEYTQLNRAMDLANEKLTGYIAVFAKFGVELNEEEIEEKGKEIIDAFKEGLNLYEMGEDLTVMDKMTASLNGQFDAYLALLEKYGVDLDKITDLEEKRAEVIARMTRELQAGVWETIDNSLAAMFDIGGELVVRLKEINETFDEMAESAKQVGSASSDLITLEQKRVSLLLKEAGVLEWDIFGLFGDPTSSLEAYEMALREAFGKLIETAMEGAAIDLGDLGMESTLMGAISRIYEETPEVVIAIIEEFKEKFGMGEQALYRIISAISSHIEDLGISLYQFLNDPEGIFYSSGLELAVTQSGLLESTIVNLAVAMANSTEYASKTIAGLNAELAVIEEPATALRNAFEDVVGWTRITKEGTDPVYGTPFEVGIRSFDMDMTMSNLLRFMNQIQEVTLPLGRTASNLRLEQFEEGDYYRYDEDLSQWLMKQEYSAIFQPIADATGQTVDQIGELFRSLANEAEFAHATIGEVFESFEMEQLLAYVPLAEMLGMDLTQVITVMEKLGKITDFAGLNFVQIVDKMTEMGQSELEKLAATMGIDVSLLKSITESLIGKLDLDTLGTSIETFYSVISDAGQELRFYWQDLSDAVLLPIAESAGYTEDTLYEFKQALMESSIALYDLAEAEREAIEAMQKAIIETAQWELLGITEDKKIERLKETYDFDFTPEGIRDLIELFGNLPYTDVIAMAEDYGVTVDELIADLFFLKDAFEIAEVSIEDFAQKIKDNFARIKESIELFYWGIAHPNLTTADYWLEQITAMQGRLTSETDPLTKGDLVTMSELVTKWYDAAIKVANAWQQVADSVENLVGQVDSLVNNIKYSALNISLPAQKYEEAERDYAVLKAAAQTGGQAEIQEYLSFVQAYLGMAQAEYKSSGAYQDIYADVMSDLETIRGGLEEGDYDQKIYDELVNIDETLQEKLDEINTTFLEFEGWINAALPDIALFAEWIIRFEGLEPGSEDLLLTFLEMISPDGPGWESPVTLYFTGQIDWGAFDVQSIISVLDSIATLEAWQSPAVLKFVESIDWGEFTPEQIIPYLERITLLEAWQSPAVLEFVESIDWGQFTPTQVWQQLYDITQLELWTPDLRLAFVHGIDWGPLNPLEMKAYLENLLAGLEPDAELTMTIVTLLSDNGDVTWAQLRTGLSDVYPGLEIEEITKTLQAAYLDSTTGSEFATWADFHLAWSAIGMPATSLQTLQTIYEASGEAGLQEWSKWYVAWTLEDMPEATANKILDLSYQAATDPSLILWSDYLEAFEQTGYADEEAIKKIRAEYNADTNQYFPDWHTLQDALFTVGLNEDTVRGIVGTYESDDIANFADLQDMLYGTGLDEEIIRRINAAIVGEVEAEVKPIQTWQDMLFAIRDLIAAEAAHIIATHHYLSYLPDISALLGGFGWVSPSERTGTPVWIKGREVPAGGGEVTVYDAIIDHLSYMINSWEPIDVMVMNDTSPTDFTNTWLEKIQNHLLKIHMYTSFLPDISALLGGFGFGALGSPSEGAVWVGGLPLPTYMEGDEIPEGFDIGDIIPGAHELPKMVDYLADIERNTLNTAMILSEWTDIPLLGAKYGGVFSGPMSGYPVELHGTEIISTIPQLAQLINGGSTQAGASDRPINITLEIDGKALDVKIKSVSDGARVAVNKRPGNETRRVYR